MNRLLFAAASAVVVLTAAGPAAAQDYPYCLQGIIWGYPGNCQFTSYAQCMATASGTDAYCGINPRLSFAPPPMWPHDPNHARRYAARRAHE